MRTYSNLPPDESLSKEGQPSGATRAREALHGGTGVQASGTAVPSASE